MFEGRNPLPLGTTLIISAALSPHSHQKEALNIFQRQMRGVVRRDAYANTHWSGPLCHEIITAAKYQQVLKEQD